jgi:hypothetical protein
VEMRPLRVALARAERYRSGMLPEMPKHVLHTDGQTMTRLLELTEDGYLMRVREDVLSPVLCWTDGSRLCCDCCAAFRREPRLDSSSGTTRDVEFVVCRAMGDRGGNIGRIVDAQS